jgi:hypothetical protein
LDLNPYWVILNYSFFTVVVGSTFTGTRFFLTRVLGAVLRDARGVSSHPHVSQVVWFVLIGVSGFVYFLGVLFENFVAYSNGVSPHRYRALYYTVYYGLYIILYYYYYFIYVVLFYSVHLAFSTYVSSYVRGGIVTLNPV